MERDQDDKPKRHRSRRASVVGGFYAEPELPEWKLSARAWSAIEDEAVLDEIPREVRTAVHEAVLDYFYERDREIEAIVAAEATAYVAQVKSAAARLVSVLSGKSDSPAIAATRDALSEGMFDPFNPAFDPLARRDENGEPRFDAAEQAIMQNNPLADALREIAGARHALDRAAQRIIKATDLMEQPDSMRAKKPTATAWATMVREISGVFRAASLPTGNKKDTSKGASNFTLFMLALTRHWPKKYQQFNIGRDGQESEQAMATAINEARKSGVGV